MEKRLFDAIILLIMSLAFCYFGLSLVFAPLQYKAFAARLERPMARAPVWVVRGFGIVLLLIALAFFLLLRAKGP